MRKVTLLVLGILMLGANVVLAEEATVSTTQPAVQEVGNKICPVSGEKVGEMGDVVKYEYNGKVYNLCCPMCKKDFAKDPAKYSKIAEDEVAQEKPAEAN